MLLGRLSLTAVRPRTGGSSTPNRDFCQKSHGALRISGRSDGCARPTDFWQVRELERRELVRRTARRRCRNQRKSVVPRDFSGKNRDLGSTNLHARSRPPHSPGVFPPEKQHRELTEPNDFEDDCHFCCPASRSRLVAASSSRAIFGDGACRRRRAMASPLQTTSGSSMETLIKPNAAKAAGLFRQGRADTDPPAAPCNPFRRFLSKKFELTTSPEAIRCAGVPPGFSANP